jgi:hypothetical protein
MNATPEPNAGLLDRKISLFRLVTVKTTSTVLTIAQLFNGIKTGRWKNEVEELRETLKILGKPAYKEARSKSLECVTISGTFSRCSDEGLECHSGLIAIDLDDLGDKLAATKQQLMNDSTVFCFFVSPSGNGLKVLHPIDAKDGATHRAAYQQILERYEALGLKPDTTGINPSRLCFVSYDPEIWVNSSFPPLLLSTPVPTPTSTPTTCILHTTLQTTPDLTDPIRRLKLLKQLEKDDPITADLYENHVSGRYTPEAGKRNEALSQLVPYWFRAMSGEVAEKLATIDLEINRGLYDGTIEEHLRSLKGLWDGCNERYPSELSELELSIYQRLNPDEQTAFRIMRDLAKLNKKNEFFMSCDQLQSRISQRCNGQRLRKKMSTYCIIKSIKLGQRREKGVRGKAASWKWMLPLPIAEPEKITVT